MDEVARFDIEAVEKLRRDARQVTDVSTDGPDGWMPSDVNLDALLGCFPGLRSRPGLELRAYQYRATGSGNGIVWAVPSSSHLEPVWARIDHEMLSTGPRPPAALDDLMEAIEGDQTPWAYLSASILARELQELGALWHGVSWGAKTILGAHPDDVAIQRYSGLETTTEKGRWTWDPSPPTNWRPTVKRAGKNVTVTFYTYDEIGTETIAQHVDHFENGENMRFEREQTVIGTGWGGIVF